MVPETSGRPIGGRSAIQFGSSHPQNEATRPLLRSDHVARPDLVDRLQAGGNRRLTLLAAPLGFGKTTLLPEWAGAEPGRAVAWLSLDDDENDPARFFAYVIAALQTAIPHVGDRALATLGMPAQG